MIVHVIAFQHRTPGEGVGGFDWFYLPADAVLAEDERRLSNFYGAEYDHAIFPYEIPDGLSRDEITDYIDEDYIDLLVEALAAEAQA